SRRSRYLRFGKLALGPESGQARARQPAQALVDQITRVPPGEELRVEAVQALDLEKRVSECDQPTQRPLNPALRRVHPLGERGELERDLIDAALAQQLDRLDNHEFGQAVGGMRIAPHE